MKTRAAIAVSSLAFAVSALATPPTVSDVTMSQDQQTCLVTVKYKLSGEPGVITLDIQTNYVENAETKWASIGPENMLGFGGDVHQVVQPTTGDEVRTIYWNPETYWPGPPKVAGTARAVVTAWATNAPPDYMIVHLTSPYDVTYYPHVEMVPGGITNIKYKGEYMPMRKIPAKGVVWMAGMPTNHVNYNVSSKPHKVMLTDDYYIGVYEVTEAQMGAIENGAPTDVRTPKNWQYTTQYRGNDTWDQWPSYKADGSFDYEKSHEVTSASRSGMLRDRTGLAFDLPTEHQWEYACRAGSPGTVYTDTLPTLNLMDATTANRICRWNGNKATVDCEGLTGERAVVGSYEPNAWGLYDMLGNVQERCVDWYESWDVLYPDDNKVYIDPVGPALPAADGDKKPVCRGYHCDSFLTGDWAMTISGRRGMSTLKYNEGNKTTGVRFVVNLH